ncbi:MAG: hypoxanthine phosphoribosyltransferase [Clostridiales bacterium]|nr:hypoxanthine phosphoribosyltransferase [Candidatus Crickella merdequi]
MATEHTQIGSVLITEEQIRQRAKEIGEQITKDFEGEKVIIIGTLKGSVPWMAELIKHIDLDCVLDFMIASSYGSSTVSSGVVKFSLEPKENLYNQNVIIVEDIIDTGNTLSYILKKFEERGPKCIKICTMLNKESRRVADIHGDYVGFEVEDLFVIGYGLDFDQKFRNLPYVSYLNEEDIEKL